MQARSGVIRAIRKVTEISKCGARLLEAIGEEIHKVVCFFVAVKDPPCLDRTSCNVVLRFQNTCEKISEYFAIFWKLD